MKIKYMDGNTRSIHYRTVHLALSTRDKLSHMVPNLSNKCLICNVKEDNIHVVKDCIRAIRVWKWLDPIFLKVLGRLLHEKEYFFGFLDDRNKTKFWVVNVLIQIMQGSIHASKFYREKNGVEHDTYDYFRRKLRLVLCRAYFLSKEWFAKEVMPLLPIQEAFGEICLSLNFPT